MAKRKRKSSKSSSGCKCVSISQRRCRKKDGTLSRSCKKGR